ncbi:MAG: hypothetical protein Kow00121_64600 [Elainellaceae cyanobacterium]
MPLTVADLKPRMVIAYEQYPDLWNELISQPAITGDFYKEVFPIEILWLYRAGLTVGIEHSRDVPPIHVLSRTEPRELTQAEQEQAIGWLSQQAKKLQQEAGEIRYRVTSGSGFIFKSLYNASSL